METIAVYWEPKIRVYGLSTQTGLSLYTVIFPVGRMAYWGDRLAFLEKMDIEFQHVTLQTQAAGVMQLCLLLARKGTEQEICRLLEQEIKNEAATSWQIIEPVELIFVHGPHFQDRYGIAEAAIAPLHKADISILAVGCSGASVYLVVPENRAEEASACLAETFVV